MELDFLYYHIILYSFRIWRFSMNKNKMFPVLVVSLLLTVLVSCNMPSQLPVDVPDEPPRETAPLEPSEDILMPTAFPEDDERDSCLEGGWTMYTAELDLLVATLVPMPNIRVPDGLLNMFFDPDGGFTYIGNLTIQIEFSENSYMQGEGGFRDLGTYATEGDTILFNIESEETEVFEWRAYKDGQSVVQPGGGPEFNLTPPGVAPYRCTAESLEIDTVNPAGDTITMFYFK